VLRANRSLLDTFYRANLTAAGDFCTDRPAHVRLDGLLGSVPDPRRSTAATTAPALRGGSPRPPYMGPGFRRVRAMIHLQRGAKAR
jgi:hypothetical protein